MVRMSDGDQIKEVVEVVGFVKVLVEDVIIIYLDYKIYFIGVVMLNDVF